SGGFAVPVNTLKWLYIALARRGADIVLLLFGAPPQFWSNRLEAAAGPSASAHCFRYSRRVTNLIGIAPETSRAICFAWLIVSVSPKNAEPLPLILTGLAPLRRNCWVILTSVGCFAKTAASKSF